MTRNGATELESLPAGGHGVLPSYSRFFQRVERRYGEFENCLAPGTPATATLADTLQALQQRNFDLCAALRITRQLVLQRLLQHDCQGQLSLQAVCHCMTAMAEWALDIACTKAFQDMDNLHGAPLGESQARSLFWVLGMGKLGGRELNVSSDIDLIYVYSEDGQTAGLPDGRGKISNQEYFSKVARSIQATLGEVTDHGFVFRLDLALRPNGNSGPAAISLDALEEYFQVQGREWERFAWLKARVVAPAGESTVGTALQLRQRIVPFVFRRYLDYNIFDALRALHGQIRDHAAKRSAGRPDRANDVKLSRGGIREIEFIVQCLQVVRGGQFPELRTRPTQNTLLRLSAARLMPEATAKALSAAYEFLRKAEHRIQYLDDQQTHILPTDDNDLAWIAQSMGFGLTSGFLAQLDQHRELVSQEFDNLLGNPASSCKSGACKAEDGQPAGSAETAVSALPAAYQQRVNGLWTRPRTLNLREASQQRLQKLVAQTSRWLELGQVTEIAAIRFTDWVETLLRRESYLALLVERPAVHRRLLHMLGAARWPARYMALHPGVIDELASQQQLLERFNPADFERDLLRRCEILEKGGEDGEEALLNLLRRAHHAETFRTLARDVEGQLGVEQVADDLTLLAEAVLKICTRWCWARLKTRHQESPSLAVIAYGKLGGKELGYGSDLDIVFVYDDPHPAAGEVYAALARKLINWLTVKTGEGDLYEIDTALRPNGSAGMLVTKLDAFEAYQQQRGGNAAWVWEHQAMTRARCVMGDPRMVARFDKIRQGVLCAARDPAALAIEIVAMRERMHKAHRVPSGLFDVKHSEGGMVDAEFAVQFLVLSQARKHPGLLANVGNIALLERAQQAGLIAAPLGTDAAQAYRALRSAQHLARLDESGPTAPSPQLTAHAQQVRALWNYLFPKKDSSGPDFLHQSRG